MSVRTKPWSWCCGRLGEKHPAAAGRTAGQETPPGEGGAAELSRKGTCTSKAETLKNGRQVSVAMTKAVSGMVRNDSEGASRGSFTKTSVETLGIGWGSACV